MYPPSFQASKRVDFVQRFRTSAALSAEVVSIQSIFDVLCVAATTTSAYQLVDAFKLLRIDIWGNPSGAATATSFISIEDTLHIAGLGGPTRRVSDESMGTARPSHVSWRPHRDSLLSKWISDSTTDDALQITCPQGSVIDVHMSLTLQDGSSAPVAVGHAVAGATVGQMYVRAFNSNGSNNIVPESFPTI